MRNIIGSAALAAVAVVGLAGSPAHAHLRADTLTLAYSMPQVSADGQRVAWQWTVTNTGKAEVLDVQLVHQLEPGLKVAKLPAECAAGTGTAQCPYGRLAGGARRSGAIEVELPAAGRGRAWITGRLTWRPVQVDQTLTKETPARPATPAG